MAAEPDFPPPAAAPGKDQMTLPAKERQQQQQQPQPPPPPPARALPAAPEAKEKPLSNAELKKKAKEEKAARRAAAKAPTPQKPSMPAAGGDGGGGGGGGQQQQQQQHVGVAGEPKAARAKASKHDGPNHHSSHHQHQQQQQQQNHHRAPSRSALPPMARPEPPRSTVPYCFSSLPSARRLAMVHADKDVNPAVLGLGQHMSSFALGDSITRLEATLLAFKKVIDSYSTPHGATFSRHFTSHVLNPQVEYLSACRPMCFSMGNAVRWLKLLVSRLDVDLPDGDARQRLCQAVDSFVRERICLADLVIVDTAAAMVADDDVVLVYAHHHLVERALLRARRAGRRFRVIVVDDARDAAGLGLAAGLAAAAIPFAYVPDLVALRASLADATLVLAAAEAMLSNGAMYARAGTCDIAVAAADLGLRVVALCESINFTDRVPTDSLTYNEMDPVLSSHDGCRMLFDTTRDKYISVVVTELGTTSAKSVPAILRKLEEL